MQAMEKQIASLTGLVQSALLKGPNTSNSKEASSEKTVKTVSSKNSTEKSAPALYLGLVLSSALLYSLLFSQLLLSIEPAMAQPLPLWLLRLPAADGQSCPAVEATLAPPSCLWSHHPVPK
ncbi:UNVERIFIED_CONTAM: hypothetical protein K2H54_026271 [Gekko kuhli]